MIATEERGDGILAVSENSLWQLYGSVLEEKSLETMGETKPQRGEHASVSRHHKLTAESILEHGSPNSQFREGQMEFLNDHGQCLKYVISSRQATIFYWPD